MIDIKGWVIALVGSRNLIGCPACSLEGEPVTKSPVGLSPVYELAVQSVAGQRGPSTFRTIRPVLLFGEIREITIPKDVPILFLDTMSEGSKTDLARAVSAAEDMAVSLRTGIVTS